MKSKNKLSIDEQLRIAGEGGSVENGSDDYKSIIDAVDVDPEPASKPVVVEKPVVEQKPVRESVPVEPAGVARESVGSVASSMQSFASQFNSFVPQSQPVVEQKPLEVGQPGAGSGFAGSSDVGFLVKVIEAVDMYRSFDSKVCEVVNRFVKADVASVQGVEGLARVIHGLFAVNRSEVESLADLVRLKEEERTSRAFSLMGLSDNRLSNLRDLVKLFNKRFVPKQILQSDRVLFCRELESGVESLDSGILALLKPVDSLLKVVEG